MLLSSVRSFSQSDAARSSESLKLRLWRSLTQKKIAHVFWRATCMVLFGLSISGSSFEGLPRKIDAHQDG
jgi:hypothetical protein